MENGQLLKFGQADKVFAEAIESNRQASIFFRMIHSIPQGIMIHHTDAHMQAAHLEISRDQGLQDGWSHSLREGQVQSASGRSLKGQTGKAFQKSCKARLVCAVGGRLIFGKRLSGQSSVRRSAHFCPPCIVPFQRIESANDILIFSEFQLIHRIQKHVPHQGGVFIDFGIVAKYMDRTVTMKDGDIEWSIRPQDYNSEANVCYLLFSKENYNSKYAKKTPYGTFINDSGKKKDNVKTPEVETIMDGEYTIIKLTAREPDREGCDIQSIVNNYIANVVYCQTKNSSIYRRCFMGYYPRLRDLREDKDLSIRALSDILHMQRTTYHNYETGKRELPFELAITLAKFYDVSLDYLGGLTNDSTPTNKKNNN